MIKKLIPIICALTVIFCGCSKKESAPTVSASFYPIYITAINITKNTDTAVSTLAKPSTGCLHDYQLTSGDIRILSDADLFIINGAGMEDGFIDEVIASNKSLTVLDSSVGAHILEDNDHLDENEHIHDSSCDHSHEQEHNHETNSHIWLTVENAMLQAENIANKLCEIFPENAEIYMSNLEEYKQKLSPINEKFKALKAESTINAIVLNEGFAYLCEPYGIEVCHTIELDENTTTSAKELVSIIKTAEENNYIVIAPTGEESAFAECLKRELSLPVYELDPVTYGSLDDPDSYIKAMEKNYEVIKEIIDENS